MCALPICSVLRTEVAPTVSVVSVMAVAQIGTTLIVTVLCPSAFVLNLKINKYQHRMVLHGGCYA